MQASNNERFKIGIDLLGGDSPLECFSDALESLKAKLPFCDFVLFLTQELFSTFPDHPSVHKVLVSDWIRMEEKPLYAIRKKKNSSLCKGMRELKDGHIDALISVGNTGALIASAAMWLEKIPSADRPALLATLPTKKHPVAVLDVGGNIHCKPKHLLQFAKMGIAYQKAQGIERPTIGLLNIGAEATKGPLELCTLHEKLSALYPEESKTAYFFGNVEGKNVFDGVVDVLVTDGFSGNIFLKTAEGACSFVLDLLPKESAKSLAGTLDPHKHHGGLLCGVDKIVIKCHGDATGPDLENAAIKAYHLLANDFLEKLSKEVASKK